MKRPAISAAMSTAFVKVWGLFPCIDCDRLWKDGKTEDGVRPLYKWNEIERDHSHELADDGPHTIDNLFPRCIVEPYKHHQHKSAKNETLRHHLDRAGKKHRGEFVNTKKSRPIPVRQNAWPPKGYRRMGQ